MKVIELKDVNLIENNTINESKLSEILSQNIKKIDKAKLNNRVNNTNSTNNLYEVNISGMPYLIKSLPYNKDKPELNSFSNKEIDNMTLINSNRRAKDYILPCKYLFKTKSIKNV